ncbi:MAG: hypothetical protein ACRD1I_05380 [Terriglobia bacterium]
MDMRLKNGKRAIRQYLRTAYSDERLVWLLAHARAGKLMYRSCCCFVGVATADHSLQVKADVNLPLAAHYHLARRFVGAREAEQAFWESGYRGESRSVESSDDIRRRRLIPMILSEMRQRARARATGGQLMESIEGLSEIRYES